MKNKIVLAGGSGFLGRMLFEHFGERGWEVVILSRSTKGLAHTVPWDGETPGDWCDELEGATAVVNLAGRSVDCRYTALNRRLIMNSRIRSTAVLGKAIANCKVPPRVWLNSSTATIYRHSHVHPMDEWSGEIGATKAAKDAFSVKVAQKWERAFSECETPRTRKVVLRTAMVMGTEEGGVFRVLRRLTRLGLGGAMAGGLQFVSWIHERDFCRALEWLVLKGDISGVVNLAAPNPLTNAEMMAAFRQSVGMPVGLQSAHWMLEVGAFLLRTETELIIKSRRAVPGRMLRNGFRFQFEHFRAAIADLERRIDDSGSRVCIRSKEVFA